MNRQHSRLSYIFTQQSLKPVRRRRFVRSGIVNTRTLTCIHTLAGFACPAPVLIIIKTKGSPEATEQGKARPGEHTKDTIFSIQEYRRRRVQGQTLETIDEEDEGRRRSKIINLFTTDHTSTKHECSISEESNRMEEESSNKSPLLYD